MDEMEACTDIGGFVGDRFARLLEVETGGKG